MRGGKDLPALHAQGGQLVDVEKAPVIDLIGGDAPVGQPVNLFIEQFFQQIEASRLTRPAIELCHGFVDEQADFGDSGQGQRRLPGSTLDDLLFAVIFRQPGRVGFLGARRGRFLIAVKILWYSKSRGRTPGPQQPFRSSSQAQSQDIVP